MNSKVTTNFFWRLFERVGAQGISFIVSIVLARVLEPDLYGNIALVSVFISVFQVFVDSGLGNALIQKKDADDTDFSSVFYFNIVICLALYAILFIISPTIAYFYNQPDLVPVIRVLALTIVISGIKNIQQAYVSKHLMFKKFFYATLIGTIGAGILGIVLALKEFGIWALVAQHLFNLIVDTIVLWLTVDWRPKKVFSLDRLKSLFSYGWKLLASSLLNIVYNDLRQLIIGKVFTPSDLAYYNRGYQIPNLLVTNINTAIDSVLLPVMSEKQDNQDNVRNMTRIAIRTSSFVIFPLLIGIAATAEQIIIILLTPKWLSSVFYLQTACFSFLFFPVNSANLNAMKAMGRSDIFLKLEVIKKVVGIIAIVSTMFISVKALALSMVVVAVISFFVNALPNRKILNYSYTDQLIDIAPNMIISCIMGGIVYAINLCSFSTVITFILQITVGICLYFVLSRIFNVETYNYIIMNIKAVIIHKQK